MKRVILAAALLIAALTTISQERQRCKGTTVKNEQCKMTTVKPSGFCHHHDPATARCGAKTTKGTPCKRTVKKAGVLCYQHSL